LTPKEFDRIRRFGTFAHNLINDETFLDVLKGLKEDAIRGWTHSESADDREACWRDMQAVGRLKTKLESLIQTYHAEIAREKKEEELKKSFERRREEMSRG
jgi:hypothetical protein